MAWAGCNASGAGGLGVEFYIIGFLIGGIATGEWALVALILLWFICLTVGIWLSSINPEDYPEWFED